MLSSETFSTGKTVNHSYNGSGNRASMTETENGESTVTKYVYDELNRLTRHYTQKPNGDTDRTYYTYDEDGNLILRSRESATTGAATNTFSFGMTSPNVDTFNYNGYGEMSQAVVGGVTTNYTYYVYRNQQTETTTDINPFRYSGEYYDAETGFTYLRARYYDPTIGRFISEDPIRDGLN